MEMFLSRLKDYLAPMQEPQKQEVKDLVLTFFGIAKFLKDEDLLNEYEQEGFQIEAMREFGALREKFQDPAFSQLGQAAASLADCTADELKEIEDIFSKAGW